MTAPTLVAPTLVAPETADRPLAAGDRVRLRASTCPSCRRTEVPPRERCAACDGPTDPVRLPSEGVLRLASSVLHPPPDALVPTPYHVGVVTFVGGRDVLGLLTEDGIDRLGTAVETIALEFAPGRLTYAFRPIDAVTGPD